MNQNDISRNIKHMRGLLAGNHLLQCLDMVVSTADGAMLYELSDLAKAVRRDYRFMLDYLVSGAADPQRPAIYGQLKERSSCIIDRLERSLMGKDRASLYFSTENVVNQLNLSLKQYIGHYLDVADDDNNLFAKITSQQPVDSPSDRQRLESASMELFNALWVAYPLDAGDAHSVGEIIADTGNEAESSHLLSAVMLGELEFHDASRLSLIMDVYMNTGLSLRIRAQALVALLICLYRHRSRDLESNLKARLKMMADVPGWKSDLTSAFVELIRTRDTERITRKMTDDIIPSMMNMRPEIMKRFESIDTENIEAMEFNPEWEEILNRSGITDKLKQMSEIQQEGGDVFMSTFSHLKRFPFFHEVANWFLPFSPDDTRVLDAVDSHHDIAETIDKLAVFCDSDKFSLAFTLKMMPEQQRKAMFNQIDAHSDMMHEQLDLINNTAVDDMRLYLRAFLRNYYRFLKLFRRKGEFYNAFDRGINLLDVACLRSEIDDVDTLRLVAEFFFKCGYWQDALDIFMRILNSDSDIDDNGALWQKSGYCYEQLKRHADAISAYERAHILGDDSRWLLRRLYTCYRMVDNHDSALKMARELCAGDTPALSDCMTLCYALLEAGRVAEAVNELRRAEFIDESSHRPWRPLAWALFLSRNYDAADSYYQRILSEDTPSATDFLNMGHLALARNNTADAVYFYSQAVVCGISGTDFIDRLTADHDAMRQAGVDMTLVPLVADAVLLGNS